MKKYAVGIDIGATHLRVGIVSRSGRLLSSRKFCTPKSTQSTIKTIKDSIKDLVSENSLSFRNDILGIGIAVASPNVNSNTGSVNWNPVFPFSKNFNLKDALKKIFKKPIFIENDLNAAAVGEMYLGELKRKKNGIVLTVSSGIGSGIVMNRDLYRGYNLSAGEVGHTILNPFCKGLRCNSRGDIGCWEALASAKSAERRYFLKYKKRLEAKEIVKLAKKGDKKSLKILKEITYWLGVGISNIINVLDPEVIVIYGSFFLSIWSLISRDIKKAVKEKSFNPKIIFKKTKLGDDGGLLGAAFLVFRK